MYETSMLLCRILEADDALRAQRAHLHPIERLTHDNLRSIAIPQLHIGILHREAKDESTRRILLHDSAHTSHDLPHVLAHPVSHLVLDKII